VQRFLLLSAPGARFGRLLFRLDGVKIRSSAIGLKTRFLRLRSKKRTALAEVHLVATVRQTAQTNWHAAMELLSRRWPEAWGRCDRVDVDLRMQVKCLAAEFGLDEREILAEAKRLVAGR